MKFLKILFILLVTISTVFVSAYLLIGYVNAKPRGIRITTNPSSNVYVNGSYAGRAPYKGVFAADQVSLKLVPDPQDKKLLPYETKVNLVPGIQTEVEYEFAQREDEASGDIVSFQKLGGKEAGIVVISMPDNADVFIDGLPQGKSPYNLNSITIGLHKVTIKKSGYKEKSLNIKTVKGLRLTLFVKLAKEGELVQTIPAQATQTPNPDNAYVVIGKTDVGFVRLRAEPSINGSQIAELKAEEKYLYLDRDPVSGWYKIRYKDPAPGLPEGMTGWVSNQYSTLTSPIPSSAPISSPSPLPSPTSN